MQALFFDSWAVLGRTLLIGLLAYMLLIVFLRVSGKRTLSKMNAFDFVVTVALGSTLASSLTWSSVRARWVRRLVTGEPSLLAHRGACLPEAMRKARVTEDEILAAVRTAGLPSLEAAESVVLETDGSFSVVRRP